MHRDVNNYGISSILFRVCGEIMKDITYTRKQVMRIVMLFAAVIIALVLFIGGVGC